MSTPAPKIPSHPIFEMVEDAQLAAPVEVAATKGMQAGYPIYGAFCPCCHPNGGTIHDMIFLNKPGRIVCKRGTHLLLTHPDFPDAESPK